MSQEYNRETNSGSACGEEGDREVLTNVENNGSGIRFARGRRAERARVKWGMMGSCTRESQHRLNIFKLTSKCMKANELLDHLKQMRGNEEEMKKEEMDKLQKDAHKKEKMIRKERDKTKKRQSGMTTNFQRTGTVSQTLRARTT